jgi:hypothetical protein
MLVSLYPVNGDARVMRDARPHAPFLIWARLEVVFVIFACLRKIIYILII